MTKKELKLRLKEIKKKNDEIFESLKIDILESYEEDEAIASSLVLLLEKQVDEAIENNSILN